MPRRITNAEKAVFSKYLQTSQISEFRYEMEEYKDLCKLLQWNADYKTKETYGNVANLNTMLAEYGEKKSIWDSLIELNRKAPSNTENVMNENCSCDFCHERSSWNGKRRYVYSEHVFKKVATMTFPADLWSVYETTDAHGNVKLRPGYGGVITGQLRECGLSCQNIATKDCYYQNLTDCLCILAYCVEGNAEPCNLFRLLHYVGRKESKMDDGSRVFEIYATEHSVKHCHNVYKVPQVRGNVRNVYKNELKNRMPKAYADELIINHGDDNYDLPRHKWPASDVTLKKIRSEMLNDTRTLKLLIDELLLMWIADSSQPAFLGDPKTDFR